MTKKDIYNKFADLKKTLKEEIIKNEGEITHYHRRMFNIYEEELKELRNKLTAKGELTKTDKEKIWYAESKLEKANKIIMKFVMNNL